MRDFYQLKGQEYLEKRKGFSADDAKDVFNLCLKSLESEIIKIDALMNGNRKLETAEHFHKVSAVYRVFDLDYFQEVTQEFEFMAFKHKVFEEDKFNILYDNLVVMREKLLKDKKDETKKNS